MPEINDQQIILQTAVPERARSEIAALADIFEEDHPNIQIQLTSQDEILSAEPFNGYSWSTDAYLKLAQAADVFFLPASPDAVQAGVIHDLAPLFTADAAAWQTDFYPTTLDAFRWDDGLWSLPTGFSATLLYYNKDLFDAANLPYPANDWTWSQFATAAKTLTVQDNGETTRWGFLPSSGNHAPIILGLIGTDPAAQQSTSPAFFTTPQFETALDAYSRFFPTAVPSSDQPQTIVEQINEGRAAMWAASAMQYAQFARQINVGVSALPTGEQQTHTTPLYAGGLSMSAGTLAPDAAWEWMRYLSGQAASRSVEQQIPARTSVAEASGVWDDLPPELAAAMQTALKQSYPANAIWNEQGIDEAVAAMLDGNKTAVEVVQTLRAPEDVPAQPTVEVQVEAEATAVPDAITINYVPDSMQNDLSALRELAKQFTQDNPGVNVNVISGTEFNTPAEMAQAGHCFESPPDLTYKEIVLPLDPLIAADNSLDLVDFYPGLLADFQQNGVQWSIPASASIYVVKYNKDVFDRAGVPYPQNGWSADEFLETALAVTSGSGDEKIYGFVAGANELALPNYLLEPLGAKLIDESVDPPTILLNSPETVDAMRWLTDLSTVYEVKPILMTEQNFFSSFSRAQQEGERLIATGRAAMWLELGSTPDYASPARSGMHLGAVSLPIGPNGSGGYLIETGFFISADSSAAQSRACWQWITYLSHQPTAVKEAPARRSVIQSESFRQLVGPELAAAYDAILKQGQTPTIWSRTNAEQWLPLGMNWPLFAYMNILAGDQSVEEAMASAQDSFDQYRACIIDREGITDSKIQRECYCEQKDSLPTDIASLICGQ